MSDFVTHDGLLGTTRLLWPTGCIDCGYDASFQPPEVAVCPSCDGRLVTAAKETLDFLHDQFAWDEDDA